MMIFNWYNRIFMLKFWTCPIWWENRISARDNHFVILKNLFFFQKNDGLSSVRIRKLWTKNQVRRIRALMLNQISIMLMFLSGFWYAIYNTVWCKIIYDSCPKMSPVCLRGSALARFVIKWKPVVAPPQSCGVRRKTRSMTQQRFPIVKIFSAFRCSRSVRFMATIKQRFLGPTLNQTF